MQVALHIGVGLVVLVLGAGVGLRWIFGLESAAAEFGIGVQTVLAHNQLRGDMGGVFLGLAGVAALGLVRREPRFLQAVAGALIGVVFGRIASLTLDGFAAEAAVAIVFELVFVTVLLMAARGMTAQTAV